jgi:membrane protein implicated in regulation of membrane protease activity
MIQAMWLWGAIGIILLAVEMVTGTFYILWFGIAAICVAVMMALIPDLSQALQFSMFAGLSLGSLAIWRLYYKKTSTNSRVGQAQGEEIGRVGIVTQACGPNQNGQIQFTQGLMGSREWAAVSNEAIEVGSHATVTAVEGNALRISKTI